MAAIRELVDATYVDVRLVGFGGEGNLGVEISEAELQRLLDAAPAIAAPHVVHPAPGEPHALPIRRRFVRAVTRAPAPLAASISDAISEAVHASGLAVPVAAVDALVREDYLRRSTSHVTLYVLNPVPPRRRASASEMSQHDLMESHAATEARPGGGDGGGGDAAAAPEQPWQASQPWWLTMQYHYVDGEGREGGGAGGGGGDGAGGCPLTKWIGSERYAWIDLSAGPVAYGGATSAEGVVTDHSMPRVAARGRQAGAAQRTRAARELAVEIAALVHASTRELLAPPVWWLPKRSYDVITLVVVVVSAPAAGGVAAPPFDAGPLRRQLAPLARGGTRVEVEVVPTSFDDCRLCAAAYAAALKSQSSPVRHSTRPVSPLDTTLDPPASPLTPRHAHTGLHRPCLRWHTAHGVAACGTHGCRCVTRPRPPGSAWCSHPTSRRASCAAGSAASVRSCLGCATARVLPRAAPPTRLARPPPVRGGAVVTRASWCCPPSSTHWPSR